MFNGQHQNVALLLSSNGEILMNDHYKEKLSEDAFKVCRLAATEQPFTGIYNDHWLTGTYLCACCDEPLFESNSKFDAGCGWPRFFAGIEGKVAYFED